MKTQILAATVAALMLTASQLAFAHHDDGDDDGGHHKHGHFKSAAAKVCKGQSSAADKKACFKQLWTQRKAAMESFDKGFTYTPSAAPAAGSSGSSAASE